MLLSVIIPVYNAAPYLRQCIESLLDLANADLELILVDDGSNDESGKICDEYAEKDARVRVFHQQNAGASVARNVGLEHACGQWISFVDADDWVESNYFEPLAENHEMADIIFFPLKEIFTNGQVVRRCPYPAIEDSRVRIEQVLFDLKYGSIGDIFGWTVAKFFKSSIIREHNIRFVSNLVFREDEIFTMDICRYVRSVCVWDKPLYNYRIMNSGLTGCGISLQDRILLAENIERNLPFFKHTRFLENEQRRLADYRLEVFRKISRIRNLHRTMRETYSYFRKNPVFLSFATDGRLAKMFSHPFIVSYCLILTDFLLEAVRGKLK